MKKIKVLLTVVVFVTAIAGATASRLTADEGIFGKSFSGECVTAAETMESGCGNGGQYQCSVYLENTGEVAPAYSLRANAYACARPMRRDSY